MIWMVVGVALVAALLYWNYRNGNPDFWKAASAKPETALMEFRLDWKRWQVFEEEPVGGYRSIAPRAEWVGPFRLFVPSLGKTVVIFGRADGLEEAQKNIMHRLQYAGM